jgi:predicted nucleotidyltransferase
MMNTKDYQIFSHFASLVRKRFPDARIWAFGSRVKGTATDESDLDVCVVLNTLNEGVVKVIREIAWEVGFEHELLLSTVTYSTEEFERGPCSQSSLVQAILDYGVAA